ncbi:hypothetical protein EW146_g813 [Bondarzewia mesenterica]|uniref:Uncharacterized protein n=1 Tax=Bondarzewia mesenterica TaxID=1095465 RepID=A0A4S4M5W6_9AGAM|nr:hypothetical protein EW146_g813 [Bondarzewia mesenterica]
MYNDTASEAPLYLVPNIEGTGKRLVRRPHPPPTTAPLPDDFDAITIARAGTTVLGPDEWGMANGSVPEIDYDDVTVQHAFPSEASNQMLSPPRAASPSRSMDAVGALRIGAVRGLGKGKASSVAGSPGEGARAVKRGLAAGRYELVQRKVLEDGPERTISIWREGVAQSASEYGDNDRNGTSTEVDSHVRRRRVSSQSRRTGDSQLGLNVPGGNTASPPKGKDRAGRRSVDMTEGPRSPLQRSFSNASSTHHTNMTRISPPLQPISPQNKQPRHRPGSPIPVPGVDVSDQSTTHTKATSTSSIEMVLSSCQPSLIHIAPALDSLGVRKDEHLRALARMREETRDREVKEEALKKGITVVEWAILLDKLQSLK